MSTNRLQLEASERSNHPRAIRRAGSIPAILYGHGIKNQPLQLDAKAFTKVWPVAGSTTLIMLKIGSTDHPVLIREVQLHPLHDSVRHIDFLQVRMDEKIRARVPLVFTGQSAAVKDFNGVLVRSHDELEIEALPQDLPHDISVDISSLTDFEKVIHVKDITLPAGVSVLTTADEVVALVQPPRSEEELKALSEEVKEDVAAVEGVEKKEEAAEGEEAKTEPETKKEAKKTE